MSVRKRILYTQEFKDEAILLSEKIGVGKASAELGLNPANIRRWKLAKNPVMVSKESEIFKENQRLKKENTYLKKINDVLKKSMGILSKDQI